MSLGCDQKHKQTNSTTLALIRDELTIAQKTHTHTHNDVILNFFAFLSPDVLATTRKQNTALDSAYGQWTRLYILIERPRLV